MDVTADNAFHALSDALIRCWATNISVHIEPDIISDDNTTLFTSLAHFLLPLESLKDPNNFSDLLKQIMHKLHPDTFPLEEQWTAPERGWSYQVTFLHLRATEPAAVRYGMTAVEAIICLRYITPTPKNLPSRAPQWT